MRITSIAAVLLFSGTMLPVYAQRDGRGDKEGKQSEKQDNADQPQGRQDKGAPRGQQRAQQPQQQQQKAQQQPQQQEQRAQQQPQRQLREQPIPQQSQQQQGQQRVQQQPQPQQRVQQPQQQQQQTQQARVQQQPQRTEQQARVWQQQRGWLKQGSLQGHDSWQQGRAKNWESDHRTWAQRGGYGGFFVAQDRFNLYFGSQHFFRLNTRPVMYQGYPRFEYGGYSFLLVDPWPEYWADNWYQYDDVYIDYDNGYYLYDRSYPQVRLAVAITL